VSKPCEYGAEFLPGTMWRGRDGKVRKIIRREGYEIFWTRRKDDGTFDETKTRQCFISTIVEWAKEKV
jgi:hypothetical protein